MIHPSSNIEHSDPEPLDRDRADGPFLKGESPLLPEDFTPLPCNECGRTDTCLDCQPF